MPPLPVITGKALLRALRQRGFALRHIRGSHHVMIMPGPPALMVSVPVHGNKTLKRGTLAAILEEAHLTIDELVDLL